MHIVHHSLLTVDSTNEYAKRNRESFQTENLTIITSLEQTAGKGREQRKWLSPEKGAFLCSFCFFLPTSFLSVGNAGQLLAISAAHVLERWGFSPQFKWPNDVLIRGRKVAGILCEVQSCKEGLFIIDAIGLNVNADPLFFEKQGLDNATSLFNEKGQLIDFDTLVQDIIKEFSRNVDIFKEKGFSPFLNDLKRFMSYAFQTPIRFKNRGKVWEGIFDSLSDQGMLRLRLPDGHVESFAAGDIL